MRKSLTLPLVLLLTGLACSEGNPVAPTGTILTVTASPNRIGRTGSTTITVSGRKPDGNPIAEGTDIFFSATLGTIERQLEADSSGRAVATLTGDGRIGTAQVTVSLDGSSGGGAPPPPPSGGGDNPPPPPPTGSGSASGTNSVTISVQIGSTPTVTLFANPDSIDLDETSTITVIARNSDGNPVDAGEEVFLTTNLGSMRPPTVSLDSSGRGQSTLRPGERGGTATVTAILGNSDPGTVDVALRELPSTIAFEATPSSIPGSGGTITLTVTALTPSGDFASGVAVTFASGGIGTLGSQTVPTSSLGVATTTLTVTAEQITQNFPDGSGTFTVSAQTQGADGPISEEETITVGAGGS